MLLNAKSVVETRKQIDFLSWENFGKAVDVSKLLWKFSLAVPKNQQGAICRFKKM